MNRRRFLTTALSALLTWRLYGRHEEVFAVDGVARAEPSDLIGETPCEFILHTPQMIATAIEWTKLNNYYYIEV
jgi:hypothetical protein